MQSDMSNAGCSGDTDEVNEVPLQEWAVVFADHSYCKPQENNLWDMHLSGIDYYVYDGSSEPRLKGRHFKDRRITSAIRGFKDGAFITRSGTRYVLVGDPDKCFGTIFGTLNAAKRLEEIIVKKMNL